MFITFTKMDGTEKKKKSVNEPKFRHVAKTKKNQKIEKGRYSKGKM